MFASLKNKIREETGSDLSKITSSWRNGAFLGRTAPKEVPTTSPSSSGGYGDSNSESISPKLEEYLEERLSEAELQERLRERDTLWQQRLDKLRASLNTVQGEEAAAAQGVARAAAAEAAAAASERDAALRQVEELREAAAQARLAHHRLDTVTEELELARREWSRERAEYKVSLGEAESRLGSLNDQLTLVKASLPPGHPYYLFEEEESAGASEVREEAESAALVARCRREHAVLRRQLQEARLALADVKTSWSGQIASLETQVARVSRQAGEEGAERRRALADNEELRAQLAQANEQLAKLKQTLANSDAKVARLSGEVRSLSAEVRCARAAAAGAAERILEMESRLAEVMEENASLRKSAEEEAERSRDTGEWLARCRRECAERQAEAGRLNALVCELQQDCVAVQRKYDKEKMEKDDALLRNAQMSQSIELQQCDMREQENEIAEYKTKILELEAIVARHRENEAACMIIEEKETWRVQEIEQLQTRVRETTDSESRLRSNVEDLEAQLADKNKKIKSLDNRIADMKKTLQRELQSGKCELTSAEDAEISRRYLKHVVLRFVTAREEARQLTRALAALLRLSAQEEAALQAALPPRTTLASWFAGLSPT